MQNKRVADRVKIAIDVFTLMPRQFSGEGFPSLLKTSLAEKSTCLLGVVFLRDFQQRLILYNETGFARPFFVGVKVDAGKVACMRPGMPSRTRIFSRLLAFSREFTCVDKLIRACQSRWRTCRLHLYS